MFGDNNADVFYEFRGPDLQCRFLFFRYGKNGARRTNFRTFHTFKVTIFGMIIHFRLEHPRPPEFEERGLKYPGGADADAQVTCGTFGRIMPDTDRARWCNRNNADSLLFFISSEYCFCR